MKYTIKYIYEKYLINDFEINQNVEYEVGYEIRERESQIDDLINWISESRSSSDTYMMKEDLKQLMSLEDEYVLSSLSTNEFISESEDVDRFNEICQELIDGGIKQNE